jgi:hypothetical protein
MLFTLKKIVGGLLLPLPALLLLIGIGIALLWFSRFQRTGKLCVSLGWLLLTLLSLQPVADSLLKPIEDTTHLARRAAGELRGGAGRRLYLESGVGAKL